MTRLLLAELIRLRSRRLSWITVIVIVLALAGLQFAVYNSVKPLTAQETAQAQVQYEQAKKEYDANAEQNKAAEQDCVTQGGGTAEECSSEPRIEWYATRSVVPFSQIATIAVTVSVILTGLAFLLLGASFIGAEYSSGALANWLSFIPERGKVFASKLVAVVLGAALVSALASALTLGLAAAIAQLTDAPVSGVQKIVELAGRGILIGVICAAIGFCLAMLTRHTIAAAGTVLGYLFVSFVLAIVTGAVPGLATVKSWLPENNLLAFLNHGYTYTVYVTRVTPDGVSADPVDHLITFGHSAVYWSVIVGAVVAGTFAVFRRRDVN